MKYNGLKLLLILVMLLPFHLLLAKHWQPVDPPLQEHHLRFDTLAQRWDEGMPMGNGLLGALVWKKDNRLRMSLDRVDLWDDRPMPEIDQLKFSWVIEKVKQDQYDSVQMLGDVPYEQNAAPTKIPGAALEFDLSRFGKVVSNELNIRNGLNTIEFENHGVFQSYVHAGQPYGVFILENLPEDIHPALIIPDYASSVEAGPSNSVDGQSLQRLGYPEGMLTKDENFILYHQPTYDDSFYEVLVRWQKVSDNKLIGLWTISNNEKAQLPGIDDRLQQAIWSSHNDWWVSYWNQSSLTLPDALLERQYYLEMYKFGSVARSDTPPISLQAVWTADNGKLPPWKGDFHHDLNTQLSYWPAYTGNHLQLASGYTNWLWKNRSTFEAYTHDYFGVEGLNVPGVTTLDGDPMGGWIQYAFGPTVAAWLGHHFYLEWRYSMNREFLKKRAYPWIAEVATYLHNISVVDENGHRTLPLSASPEVYNNSVQAWFEETTNFDLALIRWTYEKAAELALVLDKQEEAQRWEQHLSQWPSLATDSNLGLLLAPGHPLTESHRHHSHMVGFHPLGILDYAHAKTEQEIIDNTLANLDSLGNGQWVGYSFSWLANMRARTFDGEGAAEALRIFASAFCLPNSFHVNGDQSGKGYTNATYRPFTLEGNFAFAAAVQEMLIQSHSDVIRIFPAIPESWEQLSFQRLRAQGAFVVSAEMKNKQVDRVKIISEKGGVLRMVNPFASDTFRSSVAYELKNDIITVQTARNQTIVLEAQ
jgi:alpha-L-fucosidase 2